ILLFVIISLILSSGSLLFKKVIHDSEDRLARSITNVLSLSISRISFSGKYHAQIFTEQLLRREQDLLYVIIVDNNGEPIAKSVDETINENISFDDLQSFLLKKVSDSDYYTRYRKCCNDLYIKEMIMPYRGSFDRSITGVIAVGISTGAVERELFKNNLILLLLGVSVSFVGMIFIFIISNKISFPVRQLALIFQGILSHAPMSIIVRDKKGKILEASTDFRDRFFLDSDSRKNDNIKNLFAIKDLRKIESIDEEVLLEKQIVKREISIDGKRGKDYFTTLTFSIEDVEAKSSEEILCTMALNVNDERATKDELERKTAEARKASEAKGNFLATMSHEIRTPLTSIIGFLSLLRESELSDDQKNYAATALNSSESLLAIINDILDYSKIESQELSLEMISFSLKDVISEISDAFTFQAKEKNLSIETVIDEGLHFRVKGDQVRFRQILVNLVGNAIKFTEHGGIKIVITKVDDHNNLQWVRFEVRDTGIGLKPSHLEVIFDRFSQADSSIGRKFGGTGLGLSICKQLVHLMDGKIWAESVYGEGANFIFTLPFEKVEEDLNADNVAQVSEEPESYIGKKVLIADDEESNRKLMELFLSKLNLNIDFAENGQDALNMVNENSYDMVFMDVQMPEMDGIQALKHIRKNELDNNLPRLPIYAFTANVFKEQLDRYSDEGFDGHFTKPFKKKELIEFVKEKLK
ncbi:GHKL domain protein, partial [Bacteriovorax sp. BSW11_IV]|uniref:ATP-binding protein n=1 Tax=Bacteriovorax sp. BSW11_IV TaxID=1353529 RepID=UPI000389EB86